MHLAAYHGYIEIAQLLYKLGANLNSLTNKNETPLHHAANSKSNILIDWLISNGADINLKNINGKTYREMINETP
jgi:ankyrin repeat protein